MKRSEINQAIKRMEDKINDCRFALPPFCYYTPEEWSKKGSDHAEIRLAGLGWDITDYGLDDFNSVGLALITLRNGYPGSDKTYAEKLLFMLEGQRAVMHYHYHKMEDIINRGGGNVLITIYPKTEDDELGTEDITISLDGIKKIVPAGTTIKLTPGQSISLPRFLYHDFSVEPGSGSVLLGEVSMVNDDETDNHFLEPIGRFPKIEEDEAPYRLLCTEYPDGL